ncbi:MAG: hypothetical protein JO082_10960 [Mycobacterium sp.]|nr:hypothetical protein [Mycobacterium sp.]
MLINMNAFGVRTAGKTGSRHAAHAARAAVLAASHKRLAAAATDASVDWGSP